MKTRKLFSLIASLLALVLLLTACGGGGTTNTPAPSNPGNGGSISDNNQNIKDNTDVNQTAVSGVSEDAVLKAGIQGEPQTLLTYSGGVLGGIVADCIYDTLIFYNSVTGDYEPSLATKWETIDDCTTRYYLRDDVYTINGTQLKASDVVYTFRKGLEDSSSAPDYSYYDVDNFVIHDDFTIDIKTYEPFANAFIYLAQISFGIHCEADAEAAGGIEALLTKPTDTTGRYTFKEWQAGNRIVLERNDNYWGEPGYYKTIEIYFISDATTRAFALQSGDVDAITYVSATQAEEMSTNPNVTIVAQKAGAMVGMALNCTHAPFDNVLVREAIASAINKDAILQIYAGGYGSTVDVLLPGGNPLFADIDDSLKYTYDPDHAKELLAQAGYSEGELSFRVILNTNYQKIAEVIENNLKSIGVKVEIDSRELAGWMEVNNSGDYDANIVAWFPGNNIQPFYAMDGRVPFKSKGVSGIDSTEWNDLLDTLYATADIEKGREYSKQLAEIAAEQVPVVSLVSADYIFAADADLTNFYCNTKCDMLLFDLLRPIAE